MRTPAPQTQAAQLELLEQLADGLSQLLVAEFRLRHSQHNQENPAATVGSRRGTHHQGIEEGGEQ
jgi:hypothetical protein